MSFKPIEDWDAWDCFWAGGRCCDCGAWVPACQCGDWGCNLSSHDALVCPVRRDDDLLDAPPDALCECGHASRRHRNDRSCGHNMTIEGCPCEFFSAL